MWRYYNPNPCGRNEPDCAVRALCAALDIDWDTAHKMLCDMSRDMCTIPNSDAAWGAVLRQHGFYRYNLPETCQDCYTFEDFAQDHPQGVFVLGTGTHVATVRDGILYDAWNSQREPIDFVWYRKD